MSQALRRAVVETAQRMNALGINQGRSGNVSVRWKDGLLITPTGLDYEGMRAAQVVPMDLDGRHRGDLLPSSEWRFHADLYRARPEFGALVHAHPPQATTLACLRRGIPAFHYMVASAGGADIRCAPYATYGTQELSDLVLAAMQERRACLLANHGIIAAGEDLADALALAVEVETLAGQYLRCLQIGEPAILPAAEMQRVLHKFESYGKQPAAAKA